jgi:hypothetical protein
VDAISQSLAGVNAGFARLDHTARRVARDGGAGGLAGNVVDLMRARQDIRANVAVVRVADEMIGSLLDVWG